MSQKYIGEEEVQFHSLALYRGEQETSCPGCMTPQENALITTEYEARWVPELLRVFWRQEKSLGPTKIQNPDYPASSTVTAPHTVLYLLQSCQRAQN